MEEKPGKVPQAKRTRFFQKESHTRSPSSRYCPLEVLFPDEYGDGNRAVVDDKEADSTEDPGWGVQVRNWRQQSLGSEGECQEGVGGVPRNAFSDMTRKGNRPNCNRSGGGGER